NRRITLRRDLKDTTKDFVHVSDVVSACRSAIHSMYVGPVNIGTGIETSLETIVSQIAEMTQSKVSWEDGNDPGPTRMCAHWRRARDVFGWRPAVEFPVGLAELVRRECG